jgi:hypothetical protein
MSLSPSRKIAIIITLVWVAVAYSIAYGMAETFVDKNYKPCDLRWTHSSCKRYFDAPEFILRFLLFNAPVIIHWGFVWVTGQGFLRWIWNRNGALFLRFHSQKQTAKEKDEVTTIVAKRNVRSRSEFVDFLQWMAVFAGVFGFIASMAMLRNSATSKDLWNEAITCLLIGIKSGETTEANIEVCDIPLAAVGWDKEARDLLWQHVSNADAQPEQPTLTKVDYNPFAVKPDVPAAPENAQKRQPIDLLEHIEQRR